MCCWVGFGEPKNGCQRRNVWRKQFGRGQFQGTVQRNEKKIEAFSLCEFLRVLNTYCKQISLFVQIYVLGKWNLSTDPEDHPTKTPEGFTR